MLTLKENTCCFFGHRKIEDTPELRTKITDTIERLIVDENIDTFLFGSKSEFNSLCYDLVTKIKEKYPHIKRVYVRAEFPYIDESYRNYLLDSYEDTYYPEGMEKAGRAAYVERNCNMIERSCVCVVYYEPDYAPACRKNSNRDLADYQPKSGTKIAYEYALKRKIKTINAF